MIRAASVACLALLLLAAPARAQAQPQAQSGFDPDLLTKVMHLLLAQPADYPDAAPKVPTIAMVMAILGADGAILETSIMASSGHPALDARSRELVAGHRWTPLQVDGVAAGGIAILGVVWTPPGMRPPTPDEQRQLLNLMSGQPAIPQ